jgi:hypothetical protein
MTTFFGKRGAWLAPFAGGALSLAACESAPDVVTVDANLAGEVSLARSRG